MKGTELFMRLIGGRIGRVTAHGTPIFRTKDPIVFEPQGPPLKILLTDDLVDGKLPKDYLERRKRRREAREAEENEPSPIAVIDHDVSPD